MAIRYSDRDNIKIAAFDFEIINPRLPAELPLGSDLWDYAPHYISTAGLWVRQEEDIKNWAVYDTVGQWVSPYMGELSTHKFLDILVELKDGGHSITTWNGAGFDFRLLAELLPERKQEIITLCKQSYDIMFQMFCMRGFMVGLGAVCAGMGLGKKKMHGGSALVWPTNAVQIIEYVKDDAAKTGNVLYWVLDRRGVQWVTKKGTYSFQPLPKLLTVEECLSLPLPDTSWMDNPRTREGVIAWWK
jgi:hypothetical protein